MNNIELGEAKFLLLDNNVKFNHEKSIIQLPSVQSIRPTMSKSDIDIRSVENFFDAQGNLILVFGNGRGTVHIFGVNSTESSSRLIKTHNLNSFGDVFSVSHKRYKDMSYILVGTWECIYVIDVKRDYELLKKIGQIRGYVYDLNDLGENFFCSCSVNCVNVWDISDRNFRIILKIKVPSYTFMTYVLQSKINILAVACQMDHRNDEDRNVKIFNYKTGHQPTELDYRSSKYINIITSYFQSGKEILITGSVSKFLFWDVETYTLLKTLNLEGGGHRYFRRSCLVWNNQYMVTEHSDKEFGIYDLKNSYKMVGRIKGKGIRCTFLKFVVKTNDDDDDEVIRRRRSPRFLCVGKTIHTEETPKETIKNTIPTFKHGKHEEHRNFVSFFSFSSGFEDLDLKERMEFVKDELFRFSESGLAVSVFKIIIGGNENVEVSKLFL